MSQQTKIESIVDDWATKYHTRNHSDENYISVEEVIQSAVNEVLYTIVTDIESSHFRTEHDTGANPNALLVWNWVRRWVGLPYIDRNSLRKYCKACDTYHYKDQHIKV